MARPKAARPKRLAVETAGVRAKTARTMRGHKATTARLRLTIAGLRRIIVGLRPIIVGRVLIIAAMMVVRPGKIPALAVNRARRVPPRLQAIIVRLVKVRAAVIRAVKAAVMATVRLVRAVIRAVKVKAATAIVRKARVRAAVTAIARKVGKAAAIKAALVRRAGRAVVLRRLAGRVRRLRRELRARPNRKTPMLRSLRWADATDATRGAANIRATTGRVAVCSTVLKSAKKRLSRPPI